MMYENKKNFLVAKVISTDEVRGTVKMEYVETGKTFDISSSTLKRWWKKVEEQETTMEENKLVPMPGTEDPDWGKKHYAPEEVAGDGTPLAEVGKEIAQQAKEKAKAARKPKKEKKSCVNPEVPDILDFIKTEADKIGATGRTREKQASAILYSKDGGKVLFSVRFSKKRVELRCKSKDLPAEFVDKFTDVNHCFNKRVVVTSLADSEEMIKKVIANYKKEEK